MQTMPIKAAPINSSPSASADGSSAGGLSQSNIAQGCEFGRQEGLQELGLASSGISAKGDSGFDLEDELAEFKPLTPEQANTWRKTQPRLDPMRIWWGQLLAVVMVVCVVYVGWGRLAAWSAVYGSAALLGPALLALRMNARRIRQANGLNHPVAALTTVLVWEGVKLVLTVCLLALAPKLLAQVNWLALLAGFVIALKVGWVALLRQASRSLV